MQTNLRKHDSKAKASTDGKPKHGGVLLTREEREAMKKKTHGHRSTLSILAQQKSVGSDSDDDDDVESGSDDEILSENRGGDDDTGSDAPQIGDVLFIQTMPCDVIDDASLGLENDPNVLKATIDMVSTPHSIDNLNEAVNVIEYIQDQCSYDFENICGDQVTPVENFEGVDGFLTLFSQVFLATPEDTIVMEDSSFASEQAQGIRRRKLSAVSHPVKNHPFGGAVVSRVQDMIHPLVKRFHKLTRSSKLKRAQVGSISSKADSKSLPTGGLSPLHKTDAVPLPPQSHRGNDDGAQGGSWFHHGPGPHRGEEPPTPGHWSGGDDGTREYGHGRDYDRNEDHMYQHHMKDIADAYDRSDAYKPALGYGAAGDMCLMENYYTVSNNCREALSMAADFRQNYWEEEQHINHNHDGGGLVILLLVLFVAYMLRMRCSKVEKERRTIREQTDSLLTTIHNNPSLKSSVESVYGSALPPLESSLPKPMSFPWFVLRFFVIFWMVLVMMHITMHITMVLLQDMVFKGENGEEHPPSVFLVMVVFLTVLFFVVAFTVLVIRTVKYLWASRCGTRTLDNTNNNSAHSSSFNSHPPAGIPLISRLSSATGSLFNSAAVAGTGMLNMVSTPSVDNQSGYVALDQGAEMTYFPSAQASAPAPNNYVYTGIPVAHPPVNYRRV